MECDDTCRELQRKLSQVRTPALCMKQLSRDQPSALTFQQREAELRASQEEEQRKLQVGAPVPGITQRLTRWLLQLCSEVRGHGQRAGPVAATTQHCQGVEGEELMRSTAVAPPPHAFFLYVARRSWRRSRSGVEVAGPRDGGGRWRWRTAAALGDGRGLPSSSSSHWAELCCQQPPTT